MLTMRYVRLTETQYPVPITRCHDVDTRCPHSCVFLRGSQLPYERQVASLQAVGIAISPALADLERQVADRVAKPIVYVLFDPTMREGGFRAGIREYADVLVIWVNPLDIDFEYSLAHEYGHGLTMAEPTFAFLDPKNGPATTEERAIAGLASSVVDHPVVHRLLNEIGYDTRPEAQRRTKEVFDSLTAVVAGNVSAAYGRGDMRAKSFVFVNAEMLTTFRCERTTDLKGRMRRWFSAEYIDAIDDAVGVISEREAGTINGTAAAKRLLGLVGRSDLAVMYVSRDRFRERLFPFDSD